MKKLDDGLNKKVYFCFKPNNAFTQSVYEKLCAQIGSLIAGFKEYTQNPKAILHRLYRYFL